MWRHPDRDSRPRARALGFASAATCVAWLLTAGSVPAATPHIAANNAEPQRLYVKLRAGGPGKASPALRSLLGSAIDRAQPLARRPGPQVRGLDRLFAVEVPAAADPARLARILSALPEVEYAEPAPVYEVAATPNDPAYTGGQQAYLTALQVGAAWDVQKSQDGVPRPVVCIVDGGTDIQHEDLAANVWTNPGEIAANGIDDDGNGYIDDLHGWNFRSNNGDPRGSPATPGNANHGTHTAGLAAMVTDNGLGGASSSWNPFLMAVNASASNDGGIAYGYEGVTYAAENGASVVSLSWGGSGGSQAAQDVIDFAIAHGTLVVAAAGNGNTNVRFYPAAYDGVIAVANVLNNDQRYNGPSGSNFGGWIDVAAPGAGVYSTFDNGTTNSYGLSTGTSMSCPIAAAVATLIKAKHPAWGPLKVGEQLRMTCDNINAQNPGFIDQLGRGRVNALRAVTETPAAIRATSWTFADANANGELNQGEAVVMSLQLHNYLTTAVNPSLTLSSASPWVSITDASEATTTLAEDGDRSLPNAFAFTVNPNVPPGTTLDLRLDITAPGYADFQFLPIVLEPVFETHDVNRLHVSLTGTGGIGWVGFPSGLGDDGQGFTFDAGPNVLFEGALLLGTGPGHLSDAARLSNERTDFAPVLHGPPTKSTPGLVAAQEIHAAFTDSINVATPLGVRVALSSWASATPPRNDFVVLGFDITNRTLAAFDSLRTALFFDWDIDENHFDTNRTAYDPSRRLGYAWDATPGLPYVGVMALSGAPAAFSGIANNGPGPVALVDGFSKAEKWDILQGGTGVMSAGPADISNALSQGPYRVPAGGHATVYYALLAATNLANLQAAADRAFGWFADSVTTDVPETPGVRVPVVSIGAPVPNPFNPTTRILLDVRAERDVSVVVFDATGRHIKTLATGVRPKGHYSLVWSGTDDRDRQVASGVYFVRLQSNGILQSRRLVLAK